MSENENTNDFDDIVNNMGDADNDEEDFNAPLDVVEHYWKAFNPGEIFVKGILIVESATPTGHVITWDASDGAHAWEVLGMVEFLKQRLQAGNVIDRMTFIDDDDDGDDEDDE